MGTVLTGVIRSVLGAWWRAASALLWALLVLPAAAQPAFEPLPPRPAGSEFRVGVDGPVSRLPWTAIEAQAMRIAQRTVGSFDGAAMPDDRVPKIHYRWYELRRERRGGVIVVPGRTEGLAQYQETILDLLRNGWSVYIHDHRGQGFSSRLTSDDRGHVNQFDDYVRDLDRFAAMVRERRGAGAKPLHVLAHSMGGAIVSLWLQTPGHGITRAALVTPMHEPLAARDDQASLVERLAQDYCDRPLLSGLPEMGSLSAAYVTGGDFDEGYDKDKFETNELTQSRIRWQSNRRTRRDARCAGAHCGHDTAKVGGPTLRWFNQSCDASRRARGEAAREIAIPVLLLQGSGDTVVSGPAQQAFCEQVNTGSAGRCLGYRLDGAWHAVLIEADRWRVPALDAVMRFFEGRLP